MNLSEQEIGMGFIVLSKTNTKVLIELLQELVK